MTIPDVFIIIALVMAAIEQWEAKGRSLTIWAIILICLALLWPITGIDL